MSTESERAEARVSKDEETVTAHFLPPVAAARAGRRGCRHGRGAGSGPGLEVYWVGLVFSRCR